MYVQRRTHELVNSALILAQAKEKSPGMLWMRTPRRDGRRVPQMRSQWKARRKNALWPLLSRPSKLTCRTPQGSFTTTSPVVSNFAGNSVQAHAASAQRHKRDESQQNWSELCPWLLVSMQNQTSDLQRRRHDLMEKNSG